MGQILAFPRKTSTTPTATTAAPQSTSPLAAFDRTDYVYALIAKYGMKERERRYVIGRELTFAFGVHGKIRILRGVLERQLVGGQLTLTDMDGCQIAGSINPASVIGWSADPVIERLQLAVLKKLRKLREKELLAVVAERTLAARAYSFDAAGYEMAA